jgi:hypothetical protein
MANQLYFIGTINSVSGLFRVNSLAGTARVDLPDGIEDTFVSSIDPTSPIFTVVNDAGGRDLLELLDTGELVRLTDDAGAQITVASGEGIAFGDGVVFFEGTVGGEEAIWSRAADGIVTKVTDALDSGKMFEFNAGRIWVDSTSDLDSPDGLDHSAVFAISPNGDIERVTELRRQEVFRNSEGDGQFRTVDATATFSSVIGSSVVYTALTPEPETSRV